MKIGRAIRDISSARANPSNAAMSSGSLALERFAPASLSASRPVTSVSLASLRSTQAGLLAAYLLASSLFFVHLGRFTNLDGVFTLALTAALFTALMRFPSAGPWRIPYLSFVFAGIATLIKGPVALVILSVPAWIRDARLQAQL